jgi:uncharacterized circularly permuted ATP-grasp superfamily protein
MPPPANQPFRTAQQQQSAGTLTGVKGYRPEAGSYDEMLLPNGELRPHWKTFGSFLNQCSEDDFSSRSASIQRLLHDHGVTYNIYDDAQGSSRPW